MTTSLASVALHIVANRPDPALLSLPWGVPLEEWTKEHVVPLPRGLSRHVVRIVRLRGSTYAVKETVEPIAFREYRLLRDLQRLGLPAVTPKGVVTGRVDAKTGEELPAALLTEHLQFSLPYRSLFSHGLSADNLPSLVDALVVLLVRLHLADFFWGDVSLSNVLFRRSAGGFAAYLVDAETGELKPSLSSAMREYDVTIATENVFAELLDLQASESLTAEVQAHDIVELLADKTKYSADQFEAALDRPQQLGLPDYAGGEAEGYLFPATYGFSPKAKPVDMLAAMVDRWRQAAEESGLEEAAADLGYTPHELMTVASLVEAEGRGDDMPKIARVIYNRLENPDNGQTNGKLEIDATVNYALGRNLGVSLSEEDLAVDSPYNTRLYPGLPPGPIEAPGDAAIAAAADPAEGDWLYYVTVDLATGETKFTADYDEFLQFKAELLEYCETSDAC